MEGRLALPSQGLFTPVSISASYASGPQEVLLDLYKPARNQPDALLTCGTAIIFRETCGTAGTTVTLSPQQKDQPSPGLSSDKAAQLSFLERK